MKRQITLLAMNSFGFGWCSCACADFYLSGNWLALTVMASIAAMNLLFAMGAWVAITIEQKEKAV